MTEDQPTPPGSARNPDTASAGPGLLDYLSTAVLVLDRRSVIERMNSASIVVERDYDPSIPELPADPELLIQAMLNIARNAVHALGERGCIVLRTRVQRRVSIGVRQHRLMCRIEVADDGPGIPDDLVDSMFYPLVSGRDGGAGLGLSIAQSLVYEHAGIIECTSHPGETTFSILR